MERKRHIARKEDPGRTEKKRSAGKAEKELFRFFDAHPHPMWMLNTKTLAVTAANGAAVRTYNITREGFLKSGWHAVGAPPLSGRKLPPQVISCHLEDASGGSLRLDVTLHPICPGRRQMLLACVAESDVESRGRDSYFRSIFENEPACVKLLKADGTLLHLNPAGLRIMEAESLDQVVGQNVFNCIDAEFRSRYRTVIEKACDGQPGTMEFRMTSRKGKSRWMESYVIPHCGVDSPVALAICHDITEKRTVEEELRESEERYRRLVELSPEGIVVHVNGKCVFINSAGARMLGADSPESLIGRPVMDFVHSDYHDIVRRRIDDGVAKGARAPMMEEKFLRVDGSSIDVEVTAMPFTMRNQRGVQVIFRDITQRRQNERVQTALYRIAEKTNTSKDMQSLYAALHGIVGELMYAKNFYIALYDDSTKLLSFPYFCDEFDQTPEPRAPGKGLTEYVLQTGKPSLIRRDEAAARTDTGEFEMLGTPSLDWMGVPLQAGDKTFGVLVVQSYSKQVRYGERELEVLVFVSQHIASALERKQAEETIYYQAYHDPLTLLPNRMLFQDRFLQALAHASRSGDLLSMLFLDLDHFKTINDTLGHAMGDRLLQAVAKRLRENLREGDTVARLGGDEFMILVSGVRQMEDVAKIADKVLHLIRPPFRLSSHEVRVTTSIGISIYPYDGQDVDTLIRNSDTALYRAKERGRDNYQMYTPAMNERAVELLSFENDLREALDRSEFFLLYQPQYCILTGKIVGVEALIRWRHPSGRVVPPAEFLLIAEDTGLIIPIGEWVLREACSQNRRWQAEGFRAIPIAVNISARQFQQPDLAFLVSRILKETDLNPEYLELELTEGAVLRNPEVAIDTAYSLREIGVGLIIDDFGTGYSSLGFLRHFPVSTLKIDPRFAKDSASDADSYAIIAGIISMARSLKLKVSAEGVETSEQLEFLRNQDCEKIQGYLFSQPMSADELSAVLAERKQS